MILTDTGSGAPLQQLDIAHNVTDRPLFANLSDATLQLLVENARQLEEGSDVVVDGNGQVVIGP